MAKVNVYLTESLLADVRESHIPISAICQDALAAEVVRLGSKVCICGRAACWHLRTESTDVNAKLLAGYTCREHLMPRLNAMVTLSGGQPVYTRTLRSDDQ